VLRAVGAWVCSTAGLGQGFPDLLVWFRGRYHLLEVKDGAKAPSERRLTPAEALFHAACPGPVHVVLDWRQALTAIGAKVSA
jgi:hypothetical protein